MEQEEERLALLEWAGVYKPNGHFVISQHTHEHSASYIDLRPALVSEELLDHIMRSLAAPYRQAGVSAVVYAGSCAVLGEALARQLSATPLCATNVDRDKFAIPRNACLTHDRRDVIKDRNALVFNSVIATGFTTHGLMRAAVACEGIIKGVTAICDRRRTQNHEIYGVPLIPYAQITLSSFEPRLCPLCKRDIPIDETVGHGREWSAQQRKIEKQYNLFPH